MRERGGMKRVGSGVLLGGMERMQKTGATTANRAPSRTRPATARLGAARHVRRGRKAKPTEVLFPLRGCEPPSAIAGQRFARHALAKRTARGPTPRSTAGALLLIESLLIAPASKERIQSNVKDEPRRGLARGVR